MVHPRSTLDVVHKRVLMIAHKWNPRLGWTTSPTHQRSDVESLLQGHTFLQYSLASCPQLLMTCEGNPVFGLNFTERRNLRHAPQTSTTNLIGGTSKKRNTKELRIPLHNALYIVRRPDRHNATVTLKARQSK